MFGIENNLGAAGVFGDNNNGNGKVGRVPWNSQ